MDYIPNTVISSVEKLNPVHTIFCIVQEWFFTITNSFGLQKIYKTLHQNKAISLIILENHSLVLQIS